MAALLSYFSEVLTNVIFFLKLVKCRGQKVKYKQTDLVTRDIHVKYQSSSTHRWKVKVLKKLVKLQGLGHRIKNNDYHRKVLSQELLMWNIKDLALTVQNL